MTTDQPTDQPERVSQDAPDSGLSATKRKQLQRCFERGNEMAGKDKPDRDYAHTMYSECVAADPGNLVYVEAMLENLQTKYKDNKKGARFKFGVNRSGLKKAVASEDWNQVFREGLELLKTNPWEVQALRAMADACQVNRYNEVELRYLKNALDANPKDIQVNRHCAFSLTRMGQFDQAIACWHRIEELDKNNAEAPKMISQLTVAKQRFAAGMDLEDLLKGLTGDTERPKRKTPVKPDADPESVQAAPTDDAGTANLNADEPVVAEQNPSQADAETSPRKIKQTPRQRLEQAIRHDPTVLENYYDLGNLHASEGSFAQAEKVLQKALEASGGDLVVRERLEDMQLKRQRADVAVAEKRAADEGTEEAQELARRLKSELNRNELEVFSGRVERYPDDLKLKYDLALRLKRASNYEPAVPLLERARELESHAAAATLDLGECLQQLKRYGKAVQTYQMAARQAEQSGDAARQKLALYRLGVLASALKETDAARQALSQLVHLDPDYRDAGSRLDKLGSIDQT